MADDTKERVQEDLMDEESTSTKGKGRGWWGNRKAHAEAGRKGGLARSRKYQQNA
jgi:hypothetical protein